MSLSMRQASWRKSRQQSNQKIQNPCALQQSAINHPSPCPFSTNSRIKDLRSPLMLTVINNTAKVLDGGFLEVCYI